MCIETSDIIWHVVGYWRPIAPQILVNSGWDNSMLPDVTKPLSVSMLTVR